jgi:DNA-binding SARP family transcriptional activator
VGSSCRIHLLGRFAVEIDETLVRSPVWKRRGDEVIKVLALTPTHRLERAETLRCLWPGVPEREADEHLKKALKEVRHVLGSKLAVTEEGPYLRLWPHGPLWVDVHTFTANAKHGRFAEHREAALALYRGDLLPDDRTAPWTEPRRTTAREAYLQLLRDEEGEVSSRVIDLREARVTHLTG